MNAIVTVPFSLLMSAMPHDLASQIEVLRNGGTRFKGEGGDPGLYIAAPAPEFHPSAPSALGAMSGLCEPVGEELVSKWLVKLAAGVQHPPTADDMPKRIAAIRMACYDIPAGCWTQTTLAEALRTFDWWPAAAKIHDLLKPHADKLTGTRDALLKIVNANAPVESPKPREEPTPEALDHVRSVTAAFTAERSFNQPSSSPTARDKVQARHLSDGQLLQEYRKLAREGVVGAMMRAAQIEKRLKAEARARVMTERLPTEEIEGEFHP